MLRLCGQIFCVRGPSRFVWDLVKLSQQVPHVDLGPHGISDKNSPGNTTQGTVLGGLQHMRPELGILAAYTHLRTPCRRHYILLQLVDLEGASCTDGKGDNQRQIGNFC